MERSEVGEINAIEGKFSEAKRRYVLVFRLAVEQQALRLALSISKIANVLKDVLACPLDPDRCQSVF